MLGRIEYLSIDGPFVDLVGDKLQVHPFIRSLVTYGENNGFYFNMTKIVLRSNSSLINLELFRNYSYSTEFDITLVSIKESFILGQNLTAFKVATQLNIDSAGLGNKLNQVAGNNFGIDAMFGPVL